MPLVSTIALATLLVGPGSAGEVLPLRKLRLYETGVGYFERDGKVSSHKKTTLPLPASHLDDALKTMVVLSDGREVSIGGIEFSSAVSEGMGRAIAGLPLEAETQLGYHDLLASLEGIEVDLRVGKQRVRGRLIEVLGPFGQAAPLPKSAKEAMAAVKPEFPIEPEYTLVVRTSQGALRRFQTSKLSSIRPVSDAANARIDVALAAISSRSAQAEHSLDVQINGSGSLKLGYVAEAPVWRTTYRVVLDGTGTNATLQAWALIHNDTDEDWKDVEVELANGRPTSFLFPLAAPRYARRDLAEPEVALSTIPQLLNTTADRLWGDFIDGEGGLGLVGVGGGGGGYGEGFGVGGGGLIGTGRGGGGYAEPSLGDLAQFAQATGEESGALFVYRLPSGLELAAHHSALVPVVQRRIEAESITWFSATEADALMAARVVNDTDQTLPAGTVAFFDETGFQGESGFDRLKPGEQSFAVHGVDLDVDLERSKTRGREELHDVSFDGTRLLEHLIVHSSIEIGLRNRSGRARSVYVGLPVGRNATLTGHDKLDFDHTRGLPLAKFQVAAGAKLDHSLMAKEAESRATQATDLTAELLSKMSSSKTLSVQKRGILDVAYAKQKQLERVLEKRGQDLDRVKELETELERLRKDLRAIGSAGLKDRTTRGLSQRVIAAEEEISKLRKSNEASVRREAKLGEAIDLELSKL